MVNILLLLLLHESLADQGRNVNFVSLMNKEAELNIGIVSYDGINE